MSITGDKAVQLVNDARLNAVDIRGCLFPHSMFQMYVGNIHKAFPNIYIYRASHYKYKVLYSKFLYKGLRIKLNE